MSASLSIALTADYVASYWVRTSQCSQVYEPSLTHLIISFADNSNNFHGKVYHVVRKPVGGQNRHRCGQSADGLFLGHVGALGRSNCHGFYAFHSRCLVERLYDADNIFICWVCQDVSAPTIIPNGYEGVLILIQATDRDCLYGTFHSKHVSPPGFLSHGIYHLQAKVNTTKQVSEHFNPSEQQLHRLGLCKKRWLGLQSKANHTQSETWKVERVSVSREGVRGDAQYERFVLDAGDSRYYFNAAVQGEYCSVRHLVLDHKSHFIAIMTDHQHKNDFVLSLCYGSDGRMYGSMHTIDVDNGYTAKSVCVLCLQRTP